MEVIYAAYGLRLLTSFELPGMQAVGYRANDELLPLTLDQLDPAELDCAWSGPSGPPQWRGRQGDGRDLVIERGTAGDVLFSYGDHARFRLDAGMQRLDCAPRSSSLDWQRILIGKVVPSVSVMLGYEALHAAAVSSRDGVVAIMASSGSGKSTLALELLHRDWQLFADDVLTLSERDAVVSAHPGTPHMNLARGLPETSRQEALGEVLDISADEQWVAARATTTETQPVRMLCLLERGAGLELELRPLQPTPLLLAPYILGLSSDPERGRGRFSLYADLLYTAALVRLTADLECRPGQLADLIEKSLASQPETTAGALR